MKSILFTSALDTTFIQGDYEILSKYFFVYKVISPGLKGLFKMVRNLYKVHLTFIWFASVHAGVIVFLSKLLNKKTIIVLGGFDVASDKEIGYGIWNSWWRSLFVGYAIHNADYVLAVDVSIKKKAVKNARYQGKNIKVLSTGYNSEFWKPQDVKGNYIVSVAYINNPLKVKVKGIDILLQTASLLPSFAFKIIGVTGNMVKMLEEKIPSNVELVQPVKQKDLLKYYQRAKIYCQLSRTEGLPNSLCEAMLCGCVPVGTDVGGIPHAIGKTGYIVEYGNRKATANIISKAMQTDTKKGLLCRQRIKEMFPIHQRAGKLVEIVERCLR